MNQCSDGTSRQQRNADPMLLPEPVSDSWNCDYEARLRRVGLDLLAQMLDVYINDPAPGIDLVFLPEELFYVLPVDDLPAMRSQKAEKCIFLGSKAYFPCFNTDIAALFIDRKVPYYCQFLIRELGPSQAGLNAGNEFERFEGLDHVIVSPAVEADYLVGDFVLSGKHDYWEQWAFFVDCAADVESIAVRKHDIQKQQIRIRRLENVRPDHPRFGRDHPE